VSHDLERKETHYCEDSPMHRDPPEESDAVHNVLSASQLKRDV
jgi:hypothetical protein